jgi:uncharacterized protein YdhG (YjbR/CyaY superfamily)
MQEGRKHFRSIDEYILTFPKPVQTKLRELRKIIRAQAPRAQEKISYNMPAFSLNGILVFFAAYGKHIGFYPTSSGIRAFKRHIARYKHSKGAVQFPLDKPLPKGLIQRMVKFRVAENAKKEKK